MDRSPIDDTLDQINRGYQPGNLAWVKMKRPEDWERLLNCESEINRVAIQGDEAGLSKALTEYESFILKMVKTFKTPKGETGVLF